MNAFDWFILCATAFVITRSWLLVRQWERRERESAEKLRESQRELNRKYELCQRDPHAYLEEIEAESAVRELLR